MFFVLLNLFLPSYWQEKCPDKNIQEFIALSEIELSEWSGEAQGWLLGIIFLFIALNVYQRICFCPMRLAPKKDSAVFLSSSICPHVSHLIGNAKLAPEKWRIQILLFHTQYGSFASSDEKNNRSHDSTFVCLHPKSHMCVGDVYDKQRIYLFQHSIKPETT